MSPSLGSLSSRPDPESRAPRPRNSGSWGTCNLGLWLQRHLQRNQSPLPVLERAQRVRRHRRLQQPLPSCPVLRFTLKPKDRRATLGCCLNFSSAHLPGSSMVGLQVACECWWARDDSESGRDADPRERPASWAGGQERSGEQSHLPLASGAVRPEVSTELGCEGDEERG